MLLGLNAHRTQPQIQLFQHLIDTQALFLFVLAGRAVLIPYIRIRQGFRDFLFRD
jgi:hypothetical protein